MSKKAVIGSAVVVLLAAYGGGTWYAGQRAEARVQEIMAEARELVGDAAKLTHEYKRGFFTSHLNTVLEWQESSAGATIKVITDSTVRHGPLAGARFAAAVVETKLTSVEGLDDETKAIFAKASAPVLTTIMPLTGGHDYRLAVPAGQLGDDEATISWKDMQYSLDFNGDKSRYAVSVSVPSIDMKFSQLPEADLTGGAAQASSFMTFKLEGMSAQGEFRPQDGLWLVSPGNSKGAIKSVTAANNQNGAEQSLINWKDVSYTTVVAREGEHFSVTSDVKTQGTLGPVSFDKIALNEQLSRLDAKAARTLQDYLVKAYQAAKNKEAQSVDQLTEDPAVKSAIESFFAALPAYQLKLSATRNGEDAELSYGLGIGSAPDAALVASGGYETALLKVGTFDVSAKLPKSWLGEIAEQVMGQKPEQSQIDAMVGMGEAQGFLVQQDKHLTSKLRIAAGKLELNGKEMPMPFGLN